MKRISQDSKRAWSNPWVLGWVGSLALVILVNAIFIVTAFRTNPGLVDANYYERGRDHERNFQKKRETANRLGWDMRLDASNPPEVDVPVRYSLNLVDSIGMPVDDVEVSLVAYRPSDASADFSLPMTRSSAGLYGAELEFPLKGVWDLTATVRKGDDELTTTRRFRVLGP